VVKRVDEVEVRIVVAAVLADAADAVVVAHHLPKLCAHLVTALAYLNVRNLARMASLEAGTTREKSAAGGAVEVIINSAAVQQEKVGTRLYEYSWRFNSRDDITSASWNRSA
jgi:hypothetical protein